MPVGIRKEANRIGKVKSLSLPQGKDKTDRGCLWWMERNGLFGREVTVAKIAAKIRGLQSQIKRIGQHTAWTYRSE